jgi:hypothetical protein
LGWVLVSGDVGIWILGWVLVFGDCGIVVFGCGMVSLMSQVVEKFYIYFVLQDKVIVFNLKFVAWVFGFTICKSFA